MAHMAGRTGWEHGVGARGGSMGAGMEKLQAGVASLWLGRKRRAPQA